MRIFISGLSVLAERGASGPGAMSVLQLDLE
jgi:hypothetical protein